MARKSTAMRKEAALPKAEEQLRGYIEKVIFPAWGHESKNGFAILAVNLSGDSRMSREEGEKRFGEQAAFMGAEDYNRITAKGTMPNPKEGDEIIFQGRWVEDPQRGWQFLFSTFEIVLPTSEQGVVTYFSSDKFFGLGRVAGEKILKSLGPNCLNLLKEDPDLAYQITDLSKKQQAELEQKMREHGALGDLIGLICQHGIGPGTAGRIFAHYGPESVKIVKENPYRLTKEVDGIGFKIADSIGSAVKIGRNSDFRIEAAIRHVLEEAKSEGHCALRSEFISAETLDLLGPGSGVDWGGVARVGLGMIKSGELCRVKNEAAKIDYIYLAEMHDAEESVAREVLSRIGPAEGVTLEMVEQLVDSLEGGMGEGFKLAPEQRQAVIWALLYRESVVTGGPGTGKSTISRLIRAGYAALYPYANMYQVAPTGRAAKRLSETTGESASTIHRQLRYNPEIGFEYNKNNQLPGPGLLLLDEASMVDIELARSLMEALPADVQVVFIGDVDQLPSVGPGTVLRDIICSGVVPTTRLKYVYRQEEGSTISLLADMINRYDETKDMPDLRGMQNVCGGRDFKFFEAETADEAHSTIQGLMRDWHGSGLKIMDFQVLTPLKDRGAASAKHLNSMLRDIFNPAGGGGEGKPEKVYGDKVFRDGDKIMKVKRNDYKKMLFNGDIGTMGFEYGKPIFQAEDNFIPLDNDDLANIELAYAFTVHKSQGSESPLVVVVCIKAHYIMLQRNLMYTAITRAKKRLAIVGSQDAFKIAVRNNKIEHRYGLLQQRLRGEI